MILVIVESPAKCKKIEGYLGKNYRCIASFGHFRTFKNGLKSIDYDNNYKAEYVIQREKAKYVSNIRKNIKNCSEVILATDDDREGEAIAWHICMVFKLNIKTTKRIIFHEITKKAILDAVNSPKRLDMNKVRAQQSRQILDLIVGFTVSPILWKYISRTSQKGLSAGRCQTPALNLVYENEQLCKKSKGKQVYDTIGNFTTENIDFKLQTNFNDKEKVREFLENSIDFQHVLKVLENKKMKKSPPKPFITSTLQQKASNVYNMSPKNTMKCAQKLYENGFITYMRTDNAKYSKDFVKNVKTFIVDNWSNKFINKNIAKLVLGENNKSKGETKGNEKKDNLAQEAHEAIRPTDITVENVSSCGKLGLYEQKLYNLIWKNSLQSCMAASLYNVISSQITAPDNNIYKNKSEKVLFKGWEIVDNIEKSDAHYNYLYLLGDEEKKVSYNEITSKVTIKNLKTRYTEARLVQLLEKNGIGRPSTFSSLVSKIMDREYVKKTSIKGKKIKCDNFILKDANIRVLSEEKVFGEEKNKLIIQAKGVVVIEFLMKYFDNMFNYGYTKNMEDMLDDISCGKIDWKKPCDNCRTEINNSINNIKTIFQSNNTEEKMDFLKDNGSGGRKKGRGKRSKNKGIVIDEHHTWMIAKYGPVIKYEKDGETSFKKVKKNIDLDKLKRGEYTLEEIIYIPDPNLKQKINGRNLGSHNDKEYVLHSGKYGLYVKVDGKNVSLKNSDLGKKNFQDIELRDVLKAVNKEKKSRGIIREINDNCSIREGKWGPYVYYKTADMSRPKFLKIPKSEDITMIDNDWVIEKLNE